MGFKFKPSIWFVCRYCRQAFRYLYKLKEHRVENHLGECLNTKCLIFEERALDHEWIPYPNELECEDGPVSSSSGADTSNRVNSYKNPYVSLEPLTPEQLDSSRNKNSLSYSRSVPAKAKSRSCRGTKRTADKLVTLQPPADDEPCTEKKRNLDADHVETATAPAAENNIVFDSEVPKLELTIEELHQLAKNAMKPTSTSLLATESSIDNEVSRDSQEFELEDREFIVASIVKSSDGTENIQFVSTHISSTVTATDSSLQKQIGTFGTFSKINGDSDLLGTTDISAANTELPIENEIQEVTSDVLEFQIEKESNGHITLETGNLFKHDYDSICEPVSPEEYLPAETTNLSQTESSDETVCVAYTYEQCLDNIKSRAEDGNNDPVIDQGPASQGHLKVNQVLPPVVLTPEELSLPLLDWLDREKRDDPSNVILLDPDPTNETLTVAGNNLQYLHPMKCVLCKLKLTSETKVKEHVKVCWTLNKAKHVYCVACEKTYSYPFSLTRHCNKFHSPIISTRIAEIADIIDFNDAKDADFKLNQEEAQNNSQIFSDSTSNTFSSEADPSVSRSRYSTRRHKSRVNYSETQACRGCAKDFYTVEDVEDHEKLCQLFRNKTTENKQAKETVDEEIQLIGSISKKTYTNEIPSDDEDRYESPSNSESGTENEDTDYVLDRRPRSQGQSQINQILPTVTLSPKDLSLPLLDWVTKEKANDPSNVILLGPGPDPTGETLPVAVNDLHPTKCVLCQLILISDTQVKEHVKVCWTFNKEKHVYCVPCKKTFGSPYGLKRHCKRCHVPSNLITSRVIVEAVDGTDAEARNINLNAAITEMGTQINPDSISAPNVPEANLSKSGSRHSTRRRKRKVNYSETQTCRGCAKDFYTIEDLKDHEQVCPQLKPKNIKNKETENKETEDVKIEVVESTAENILAHEVPSDDDTYECPDSSESSSDLESDGYVTDTGHPSHYSPRRRGAVPTITPSREDLSLPLAEWLKKEKINDPSNVILLDPDPTNETTVVEVTSLHPMKCVLCNQKLTSDTQVKEHVKLCWNFRKTKYTYCVPCKTSFANNNGLYRHLREVHRSIPTPNLNFIPVKYDKPLKEWLVLQKQEKHSDGSLNVILIDPDPTSTDLDSPDMVIDSDHPVTCLLCQMLLFSDPDVRNHVENCWWHNKRKHRRCVPCEFTFETPKLLRNHQTYDHAEEASATNEESEDSDTEQVGVNNDVIRVDLVEWLRKRQGKSSNVIRLDPDPTKATGPLTISKKSPIKCMLCNAKLTSDCTVKVHAKMCWHHNKKKHTYCVLCEKGFSSEASLNEHKCNKHFPGPNFSFNCTACRTGFKDRVSKKLHTLSRLEFLNQIVSGKYAASSTAYNKPLEISLGEWLRQQKEENPSICILLEPDPLSMAHKFEGVSEANPVKCKLCFREFTAELVLRSHVKMCWSHNRRIHRHCIRCNKTYESIDNLKVHNKWKHHEATHDDDEDESEEEEEEEEEDAESDCEESETSESSESEHSDQDG